MQVGYSSSKDGCISIEKLSMSVENFRNTFILLSPLTKSNFTLSLILPSFLLCVSDEVFYDRCLIYVWNQAYVCYSKKQNSAEAQSPIRDTASRASTANKYQAMEQLPVSTPVYESTPSSSPAAAAASPVINATGNVSSVYSDTTTTLVDNALYDVQQLPVTSSNVAETADDVTDLTLIDNDLYEREGQPQSQQNSGFTDYECTLIDNDLYR